MKKLQILIIAFLISLAICAFASMQAKAQLTVGIAPVGPLTLDVGQSQTFTATASGVTGTASYQWELDSAAVGSNSASYSYTASGTSHTISVTVTDDSDQPESAVVFVTVSAVPIVGIAPVGPLTLDVGQSQLFTATPSGGSGTFHYQWYVVTGTVGTDRSSYVYTASGTSASVTCKVTDSASTPVTSAASNAVFVTVSAVPIVGIAPVGPLTLDVGQSQLFTATPSGGSGTIHYQWYVGGSAVSGATDSTYSFSESAGSYSVTCKVTDSASTPVTSAASNAVFVTVSAVPIVGIA